MFPVVSEDVKAWLERVFAIGLVHCLDIFRVEWHHNRGLTHEAKSNDVSVLSMQTMVDISLVSLEVLVYKSMVCM